MDIYRLFLSNFRNYNDISFKFSDKLNIIYGKNAQGKTNIIESIYMLGSMKSFRVKKDIDTIQYNKDKSYISADIKKNEQNYNIVLNLNKLKKKELFINNSKINKYKDIIGFLKIILFSPDDINLMKADKLYRRKFLNFNICQFNRYYIINLLNYNKLIHNRNILLRKNINKDILNIYNNQLVKIGSELIKTREYFIKKLNELTENIYNSIFNQNQKIRITYNKNVEINNYKKSIESSLHTDICRKFTTIGPHRDDFEVFIDNKNIKYYGSQGQHRLCVLSLKLAELEIIKQETDEIPILLLDDVFSELDSDKKLNLLKFLDKVQTFITTTDINKSMYKYNIFNISNGMIINK